MSDVSIDFTPLFVALGLGAAAALVGMPVVWRLAARLPWLQRILVAVLVPLGLAGFCGLLADIVLDDDEIAPFTLALTGILQALVLPVLLLLLFLNRKTRTPKA